MGEIVKLVNISNEGWSASSEKIFYFARRQEFPTFLRYFLYSMPTTSIDGLSAIYFLGLFT